MRVVIERLDPQKLPKKIQEETLVKEITNFVDQYMLLREVEKKLLKESGNLFSGTHLRQQVLQLIPKSCENTTERYLGGAKERARERVEQGIGDDADMSILEGKCCAYCGGDLSSISRLPGVSSTYCSRECVDQGRLKRGWGNQLRAQVFALEGGVCSLCGVDGHAMYTRVLALEPAERLNALCNANWKLPRSAKALDRLLQNPREGDFWQADHILAVAEGGGSCGLENLRTLCVPCHTGKSKFDADCILNNFATSLLPYIILYCIIVFRMNYKAETEKLHIRLKLRGAKNPGEQPNTKKQVDIRSMFKRKASSSTLMNNLN